MPSTVWKGYLSFGLVSVPVRLHTAARAETVHFNQLHRGCGSRIKQVLYCAAEDKPLSRSDIVKGYEYEKDRYVVVEDEDVKKVAPKTAKVMEIVEFVPVDEVDPIYLENSYYMAPEDGGEKPYALLFETLRRMKYMGIAKVAMHNREHVVMLRPGKNGIVMHTMYYADEIRKTDEFRTDTSLVKDKELELATMLVQTLAAGFEPEKYKDTYSENLRTMIDAKLAGQEVVETPAPQTAQVVDIMEALKTSLAALKKPVASAEPAELTLTPPQPVSIKSGRKRRASG